MLTSFDTSLDLPSERSAGILFRVEMLSQVLLRLIGVVFLSSVALKIVDLLFYQKASLSPLFCASLPADLAVGTLLLLSPSSLFAQYSALFFASVYLGLHYLLPSQTCDCFGVAQVSTQLTAWILASLIVLLLAHLLLRYRQHRAIEPSKSRSSRALMDLVPGIFCIFGFLFGLLLVSSFRDRPLLIAEIIPGHLIRDGFLDGKVRLWNAADDPIRLVGAGRTRCEGIVSIDEPILLESGQSSQQRCVLPWRTTSLFRSGVFRLNVERGGNAEVVDVSWVVLR